MLLGPMDDCHPSGAHCTHPTASPVSAFSPETVTSHSPDFYSRTPPLQSSPPGRLTFPWMVSTHRSSWRWGLPQLLWMLQILSPWAVSSSLSLHSLPSHKHLLESESRPFLWAWIGSLKTQQTSWIQRTQNLTKMKPLILSLCPIPYRSWLTLNTLSLSNQSAPFHGHRLHTHDFSMFHLESVTAAKLPQNANISSPFKILISFPWSPKANTKSLIKEL